MDPGLQIAVPVLSRSLGRLELLIRLSLGEARNLRGGPWLPVLALLQTSCVTLDSHIPSLCLDLLTQKAREVEQVILKNLFNSLISLIPFPFPRQLHVHVASILQEGSLGLGGGVCHTSISCQVRAGTLVPCSVHQSGLSACG